MQFWHKPFFSNFLRCKKWLLLCVYRLYLALPWGKSKLQACNAPFVQFWHKPFFSNFLRCQNGCFCAFIACGSVFNRTCHSKSKLQAWNAPNVQFWHKPFFSNFLRVSIMAGIVRLANMLCRSNRNSCRKESSRPVVRRRCNAFQTMFGTDC